MSKAIYRYTGGGEYYPGIPARDLTQDDLDALDDHEREIVLASSLYEQAANGKAAAAPAEDAPGAPQGKAAKK